MLKKLFSKDELYKHVFTLVKGTVLAQLISILSQPVLRRVFTPEDFGIYALYISVVSIFSVIATGRFEMTIVLPKCNEEAKKLFNLSIVISFIVSLLLFLVLLFTSNSIVSNLINKNMVEVNSSIQLSWLKASIFLLPLGIFLLSIYNTLNYFFIRHEKYNVIANTKITNTSTNVGSSLGFGFLNFSFIGVILGYLIGSISGILFFIFYKRKYTEPVKLSSKGYWTLIKEYIDFPTKSMLSGLLNMLATQLPILFIGSLFGVAIVGFYELIIRVLNIPITMIGKSVSQVFFQKISNDVKNENEIGSYVRSFSLKLFLFMLIPMTIIFFFGESLFSIAFGSAYKVSGELASYFALFFLVRFVYYSQSTIYTVKRKLGIELKQNTIYLLSQICALLIGYYYFQDFKSTFILLAFGGFLCYLFFLISLIRLAGTK